jgi:hypothetical protein
LSRSVAGDAQDYPCSLKAGDARAICRSQYLRFMWFAGLR